MSRNHLIAVGLVAALMMSGVAGGIVYNESQKPKMVEDLTQPALDVDAYMSQAPTIPQCYVNEGNMTYQVPCNSQAVIDQKKQYDRNVEKQLKWLKNAN